MIWVGVEPGTYCLEATYLSTCAIKVLSKLIFIKQYNQTPWSIRQLATLSWASSAADEVMLDIPVCVHLCSSAAPGILWNSTILLCIHCIAFLHFLTHTKRNSWPLRFHSSFFQSFSLSWRFADLNLCSFRDTVILEVRRSLLQARPVCWSRMATRF